MKVIWLDRLTTYDQISFDLSKVIIVGYGNSIFFWGQPIKIDWARRPIVSNMI